MIDNKKKDNDWGLGDIPELLDELFGYDPGFIDPSDIKRITDDMKDLYFEKYNCELKNGRVRLPLKGIKVWAVAEIEEDEICRNAGEKYILLANNLSRFNSEEISVLMSGECTFDEKGKWKLPDAIIKMLDSESLICEGCGMYTELMTEKSMARKESKILEYCNSLNKKTKNKNRAT